MNFFFFFLESDRIFFPKKLVRQVIKLEWPEHELSTFTHFAPLSRLHLSGIKILNSNVEGIDVI